MFDSLLGLLTGVKLDIAVLAAAVIAAVGFFSKLLFDARRAGRNEERAKGAKVRDQNLEEIKRAVAARDAAASGSVHDDPNNRDNRA